MLRVVGKEEVVVFRRFEDIEVWQDGRRVVNAVYEQASGGVFAKDWGLKDQIQRAAVSICSNIAEGHARRGNKEMVKFLWIAKGSASEVQSQLYHALDRGYVIKETFDSIYADLNRIQAKIYRLIQSLSESPDRQKI